MANPVFELYNFDGTLHLNIASGITKVLGVANLVNPTYAGSITVPEFAGNRPWFCILTSQGQWFYSSCTVEISGTTLSWSTYTVAAPEYPIIQYGIY